MAASFDRKAKSGSSLRQDTSLIDQTETYNDPSVQAIRAGDEAEDTQSRISHHSSDTTVHPGSKGLMARQAPRQACTQFYLQTIRRIDLDPPSALPVTDRSERRERAAIRGTRRIGASQNVCPILSSCAPFNSFQRFEKSPSGSCCSHS